MKHISFVVVALFGLLFLQGCNQPVQQSMKFQVNPQLIGKVEQDSVLQITYAAPASFSRFTEEEAVKLRSSGLQQKEEGMLIRSVYQDARTQAFMIISSISKNRWRQLKKQMNFPEENMPTQVWNQVKATEFEYNNFKVQQWLMQNQDWIDFKLMYEAGGDRYFQVDYLVPQAFYDEIFARAIESSIGSFKSL